MPTHSRENVNMSKNFAIEVTNVSKRYQLTNTGLGTMLRRNGAQDNNHTWALKDINFAISTGTSWGIIGKNGSGKTTLLRVLGGITYPTTGTVRTSGRIAAMLAVGVGFNIELSGRENVYLNGSILGFKKVDIDKRFDEIVAFSEIGRFIDTPVKRYSSGMRVRLGFAVAAFLQPEIWLIDEVLAVGDIAFRQKAMDHLKEMASTASRTLLLVSHNMGAIQDFCENAIWLKDGQIAAIGDVEEVVQHYLRDITVSIPEGAASQDGKRHEGTQEAVITNVELLNRERQPTSAFLRGDDIVFRIYYTTKREIILPIFTLKVVAHDSKVLVSRFHSIHDGLAIGSIRDRGYVEIMAPNVPWMPGNYRYIPSIEDSQTKQTHDLLRTSSYFEILPDAQLLKTKYRFDQMAMAIYLPVEWLHQPQEREDVDTI